MAENKNIISQDVENREITVNEDGSIKVIETLKTIYTQQYREFLSDFRGMQKYEENIKELFTNEFKKKREDDLKKIQKEKDKLAPYVDEAEKKWIEFNEKKQKEDMKANLRKELEKENPNENFLSAVYQNFKEKNILEELTEEERKKLTKIHARAVRKSKR